MYSLDCKPGDIISYNGLSNNIGRVYLVLQNISYTKLILLDIKDLTTFESDIKDDVIVYRHIEPTDIEKFLIGGTN